MSNDVLFVCGSLNQTTMMHQIAMQMPGQNCYFTPFFADGLMEQLSNWKLLDFTILGGRHRLNTERYLAQHDLAVDFGGQRRSYDLVVTCTDLIIQHSLHGKQIVLVQEGMTEPETLAYTLVKQYQWPRWVANTAATGLSDAYRYFCVASPGYRELFIRKGVRPEKLVVTGIPNFDQVSQYRRNYFPLRHFVLAATSSTRETLKWDNRLEFLHKVRRIAAGRLVVIKLHPNENVGLARREINHVIPEALVLEEGNLNHMIANCDVFITQTSSATFVGLALGKEVYTDLDVDQLRQLMPLQNGGTSALRIAELCERLLDQRVFVPRALPLGTLTRRNAPGVAH
jgi:hypothetical protein